MPDVFGNETPQEAIARVQQGFRDRTIIANQSGSKGQRAGQALANLFGAPVRKAIDTRAARKAEVDRLMKTQGLSREVAEQQAKENVDPEFKEVRRAKRVQEAGVDMTEFMESLDPSIPPDMRIAQGKLFMSNRLRTAGLTTEANNLAAQANADIAAAQQAALERENLKARTRASNVGADKTEAEIAFVGTTEFQKNVIQKEQIIGQLNDPNSNLTQFQRESLMRAKGHLEAKILKDETIIGRTEEDVRNDPVLMRKLFADVADNEVLVRNIDSSINDLQNLDNFDRTFLAGLGKDALGFMDRWFGRKPTESEQEFIERVQSKEGKSALIAAKVRHALTGAQMSAFEIVFLTPFLPDPDDSVATQIAKMRIVRDYTQLDTDTRMQLFQQGLTESWLESAGKGISNNPTNNQSNTPVTKAPGAAAAAADSNIDAIIKQAQGTP